VVDAGADEEQPQQDLEEQLDGFHVRLLAFGCRVVCEILRVRSG
jgi:hypothetical protein